MILRCRVALQMDDPSGNRQTDELAQSLVDRIAISADNATVRKCPEESRAPEHTMAIVS